MCVVTPPPLSYFTLPLLSVSSFMLLPGQWPALAARKSWGPGGPWPAPLTTGACFINIKAPTAIVYCHGYWLQLSLSLS